MTIPPLDAGDQLESLLARWATGRRLTDEQATAVYGAVLAQLHADGLLPMGSETLDVGAREPSGALDVDWFWDLLRPVTALLDGPNRLNYTLSGLISVGG